MDIILCNVTKCFDNKIVLDNISMCIESKKITALVGSNGSGKTTLIKCISTLNIPDDGTIKMGSIVYKYSNFKLLRRQLSVLIDGDKHLVQNLTLIQNIKYLLALHGKDFHSMKQSVYMWLEKFSLTQHKNKVVSTLSRGMKQKLAIVCTLAQDSKCIFFDEPLIGLDIHSVNVLIEILKELRDRKTIVISTHNIQFAKVVGDNFICMD